jgi:2,4-dienoyl-CoA reductase-like NADH-dependent reductase (Old Yellow Enzyme family)
MPSRIFLQGFKPLADTALFKPIQIGALKLDHRIVQALLTRMRGTKESEGVWAPGDMNAEWHAQRASKGGFQLTEAKQHQSPCKFSCFRARACLLMFRSAAVIRKSSR